MEEDTQCEESVLEDKLTMTISESEIDGIAKRGAAEEHPSISGSFTAFSSVGELLLVIYSDVIEVEALFFCKT